MDALAKLSKLAEKCHDLSIEHNSEVTLGNPWSLILFYRVPVLDSKRYVAMTPEEAIEKAYREEEREVK